MSNFIKLSELAKRDLQNIDPKKYQIQGSKNSNMIKVACVEKEKKADVCLAEHTIDNFIFALLAYTLSDNDINNKRYYMIGYLIKNTQNYPIGTLNIVFCQKNETKMPEKFMEGNFKIVLSNNKNEHQILKEMEKYPGDQEAIHLLTEALSETLADILAEQIVVKKNEDDDDDDNEDDDNDDDDDNDNEDDDNEDDDNEDDDNE
jgi:hypothetical protein